MILLRVITIICRCQKVKAQGHMSFLFTFFWRSDPDFWTDLANKLTAWFQNIYHAYSLRSMTIVATVYAPRWLPGYVHPGRTSLIGSAVRVPVFKFSLRGGGVIPKALPGFTTVSRNIVNTETKKHMQLAIKTEAAGPGGRLSTDRRTWHFDLTLNDQLESTSYKTYVVV